jgi:hypothetical protein
MKTIMAIALCRHQLFVVGRCLVSFVTRVMYIGLLQFHMLQFISMVVCFNRSRILMLNYILMVSNLLVKLKLFEKRLIQHGMNISLCEYFQGCVLQAAPSSYFSFVGVFCLNDGVFQLDT